MSSNEVRLSGIIVPSDWDDGGLPIRISIATAEESIVLDADRKILDSLFSHLHDRVEIVGILGVKDDRKSVLVRDFSIKTLDSEMPLGSDLPGSQFTL